MERIEDIYEWFTKNQDYLRPTDAEVYDQQREAEELKCGYSIEKGKPGTFRANLWVPYGLILIFDPDLLNKLSSTKIEFQI